MKIGTKLTVSLVVPVIAVMAIDALITISQVRKNLTDEMQKKAEHMAMTLGAGLLHHMEINDPRGVRSMLEAVRRYEDIVGVGVLDSSGTLIATTYPPTVSQETLARHAQHLASGQELGFFEGIRGKEAYTYLTAIRQVGEPSGRVIGRLSLSLTVEPMERLVLQTRNHALIAIGVMTVALTLMVFLITRAFIAYPMATLAKSAEKIGQGAFNTRIPITTADEIGLLSQAFNQMAERLAEKETLEHQIRHAEKLAAVGQLAAGIAHEIGTPLNVISGNAEYLLMDLSEDDPRTVELKAIIAEVDRITRMIRQLLNFARYREARRTHVNVNDLIEEMLTLITHQIEKRKIERALSLAPDLPRVHGDTEQLKQVFLNLTINACQAMPDGGTLTITTRPPEQRSRGAEEQRSRESPRSPAPPLRVGGWVEVVVADTGPGIHRDDLERIFDPFFTTKEPGEGTGLGLTISRRIIEDHGGRMSVSSEPGSGSTFTTRLPAV